MVDVLVEWGNNMTERASVFGSFMEKTPLRLRPKQKKEKVLQTCEDNTLREEQTAKS